MKKLLEWMHKYCDHHASQPMWFDSESREEVVSLGSYEGGVKKQSELCAWDSNDVGII